MWSWFFSIALLVVFMLTNQVRQGVALAFFVLSLPYFEQKRYAKMSLFLLLAILFHYSAIICVVFYFMAFFARKYELPKYIWTILLLSTLVLYYLGAFYHITLKLLSLVPKYGDYASSTMFNNMQARNTGLGLLLMTALGLLIIFLKDRLGPKYRLYYNMAIIYFILFLMFSDLRVVLRVTNYLYVFVIITFALIMENMKVLSMYKVMLVMACFIWWGRYMYLLDRPYKTVFSQEFHEGQFYDREWGSGKADRDLKESYIYDYEEDSRSCY